MFYFLEWETVILVIASYIGKALSPDNFVFQGKVPQPLEGKGMVASLLLAFCRVVLGFVFALAFVGKLRDIGAFQQ